MRITEITSIKNPKIKGVLALCEKSKLRKEQGLFVAEGIREVKHCIEGNYHIQSLFYCPQIIDNKSIREIIELLGVSAPNEIFTISNNIYSKIAYRESTEGIIAIVEEKSHKLDEIKLSENPLVIVIEAVEKPGNIGAILRTADACGADALIICQPLTDLYNPNIIRSSLGGVFTVPIAVCSNEDAAKWLKDNNINIYTAQLQDSKLYYDTDFGSPCAIVFGSESKGLTNFWREISDSKIIIPMLGKLDSLNVSVSVSILCYEALRQKREKR